MASVTVKARDCNLEAFVGRGLELAFTLSDPATAGDLLLLTDPIVVPINTTASVSVVLQDTETMDETRHYSISATWLDPANSYVRRDFPAWELFVPIAGGSLPALIANYSSNNPFMVYWQTAEPNPWPVGTTWVDTSVDTATSGDVRRRTA